MTKTDPYLFLKAFGKIDENLIEQASRPWEKHRESGYRGWMKKAACVLLICLAVFTAVFHTEVKAALIRFTTEIGRLLGITEDLSDYTEITNLSETKNGLTLELKEAILDKDRLILLLHPQLDEEREGQQIELSARLWLNGKAADALESYAPGKREDAGAIMAEFRLDQAVEEEMVEVCVIFTANELQIEEETGLETGEKIGDYEFAFRTSRTELEKHTERLPLEEQIGLGQGIVMELKELSFNRLGSSITGNCENLPFEPIYELRGTDDLGNEVRYSLEKYDGGQLLFVNENGFSIKPEASRLTLRLYRQEPEKTEAVTDDRGEMLEGEETFELTGKPEAVGEDVVIELKK